MAINKNNPDTIDDYIQAFPEQTRQLLEQVRSTIREAAPLAEEKISYGIPTFTWYGNLVHFGAYKQHIGFYPAPSGIDAFREELAQYEGAKGSIRFPLPQPLPLGLIRRIVLYRVEKNSEKSAVKKRSKPVNR